jgi:hypothetical protein
MIIMIPRKITVFIKRQENKICTFAIVMSSCGKKGLYESIEFLFTCVLTQPEGQSQNQPG